MGYGLIENAIQTAGLAFVFIKVSCFSEPLESIG